MSRPGSPTGSASASAVTVTPAKRAPPPATSTCWCASAADERFVREGDDLITALDVAAPLAALGDARGPALEGAAQLELPPGTQPGEVLTIRGAGMPGLRRGRQGDLRVVVNVLVPRRLTPSSVELAERLNESLTEENLRSQESMFAKLRRALGSQAA